MKVCIIGATSDIAREVAKNLLPCELYLAARSEEALNILKQDYLARGASKVVTTVFHAEDNPEEALSSLFFEAQAFDILLIAHGSLDKDNPAKTFNENCLSQILLVEKARKLMKNGKIAVISSVAADRGRKKVGLYGAAKAALDSYLSAVRQEEANLQICTIKPGFVKTKMTAKVEGGFLPATPEKVGADIASFLRGDGLILYTPWFWRWVMLIIRFIPERIFMKMNF